MDDYHNCFDCRITASDGSVPCIVQPNTDQEAMWLRGNVDHSSPAERDLLKVLHSKDCINRSSPKCASFDANTDGYVVILLSRRKDEGDRQDLFDGVVSCKCNYQEGEFLCNSPALKLKSVVTYSNNHYVAWIRHDDEPPGTWLKCDDALISNEHSPDGREIVLCLYAYGS